MAKNTVKDILIRQLTEENQNLLNDLKLCQKRNEFLENYRKVFNQFNKSCVCDQNKITTYLFQSLEQQYKQILSKESKIVTKKRAISLITETQRKKLNKNNINLIRSEAIKKIPTSDPQIKSSGLPTTSIEIANDIIFSPEEPSNQELEVESESPVPQKVVFKAKDTTPYSSTVNVPKSMQSKEASQPIPEDDSDLTFPSFNDPIFSLNANYVEELAAQVVPKLDEQVQMAPKITQNTNDNQKRVSKPELKTNGQTLQLAKEKQVINTTNSDQNSDNSDPISVKSNLKFIILLENLKNGRLQSFNDPNNDMISVFLKSFNSIDGKKVSKIVYKCNYSFCGFETNSQQYIHRHIDRHKTSKLFKSSLIKYRTFSVLLDELKSGKLESFIDPDYDLVLVTLKRSDSFEDQNQSELIYNCLYPNCQFETNGKYYIRSHILRHNKVKTFSCNVCQETFGSNVSRVEHQIKVHNNYKNRLFKCDFAECEYKTTVRQTMKFHKMRHKSEKTFKCETNGCDLYFKSVYQMKSHMKRVHVLKTVMCEWPGCEARFKTKYELRHHIMSHTGEKITVGKIRDILKEGNFVSTVDKNNKLFSVIRQQNINESNGLIEIGPKLGYKCNFNDCKFICKTPRLISEHTLSHSMGKAYECDLCHKTYTLRGHLNNHKKLVHNINNNCPVLKCTLQECDYSTRNPYCFRQHQITHRKDTPFKCSENGCEKCFKTTIALKHHINNSHKSCKSLFACNWPGCKSSFKSKSYLKYHKKTHSKPKEVFVCQSCGKTFNFKANLTKHTKSQHSIE